MNNFSHPAFAPYRELIRLTADGINPDLLNKVSAQFGICHAYNRKPLRFSSEPKPLSASEYEQTIAETGIVPTREQNLHDYLNALVWLRFPRLKSAINLRHCQMLAQSATERQRRGTLRDRLTLLDESGVLVAASDQGLLNLLQGRQWLELFWHARANVIQGMRFMVVGHGLLEKCLNPFPGMTGKCLLMNTGKISPEMLDMEASAILVNAQALELPPLPLQGIPGWSDNNKLDTYLDTTIFRPARTP